MSGQPSIHFEDLDELKQLEFNQVSETCLKICKYFHRTFNKKISWEEVFFLSLQFPISDPLMCSLLNYFQVFESISPSWSLRIPSSSLVKFTSFEDQAKLILQIIDFAKGRFWIESYQKTFLCILPLFDRKLGIFGVVFKSDEEGSAELIIDWLSAGLPGILNDGQRIRAGLSGPIFEIGTGGQEILNQTIQGYQPRFAKVFEMSLWKDLRRPLKDQALNLTTGKEIWVLYEFPQGFRDLQAFLCFDDSSGDVQGHLEVIRLGNGKNVYLIVFRTGIRIGTYFFKVLEPKIVPGIEFYEKTGNRKMNGRTLEFLFDVNFDKTLQNRNFLLGNPLETFQAHAFYFFYYLVKSSNKLPRDELLRTCKIISKAKKSNVCKDFVFFELANPTMCINNIEDLFLLVSIFSFQRFLPSETKNYLKNVRFIIKSIIKHGKNLENLIKMKPFSRIFLAGLAVSIAAGLQMKINQVLEFPELLETYFDNYMVFKLTRKTLKLLKTSSSSIDLQDLTFLVDISETLLEVQKSMIGETLLELPLNLQTLIKAIQLPLFNYMKNEEKSEIVSLKFASSSLSIDELIDFLKLIREEPEKSLNFIKNYQISAYLDVFFSDYLKSSEKSLKKITEMFEILKNDDFFNCFSPKNVLFKVAEIWDFKQISDLFLIYSSHLIEVFNHWLDIHKTCGINELILMIDSQVLTLPSEQQKIISKFSVSKFSSQNFRSLLQTFDLVKTKTFRNNFLKATLERLLNDVDEENLMKELILNDFPVNENSIVLRQIILFVESRLKFSTDSFNDLVFENPSSLSHIFVFLDRIDIQKKSKLFQSFSECAMKFFKSLENEKITFRETCRFIEFNDSQKNAFLAYFELLIDKRQDFEKFLIIFANIKAKTLSLKRVLKQMKTFIYKLLSFFELKTDYKQIFEEFSEDVLDSALSIINCPKELKSLYFMLESLDFSLSSSVFLYFLKSSKISKNLEEKLSKSSESLKDFLFKITSKDSSLNIQVLASVLHNIETPEEVNKECDNLCKLVKEKSRFSNNFHFFTLMTIDYRFFTEALFYFKDFLEVLHVPCFAFSSLPLDFSKDSINLRAGIYREIFGDFDSKSRENLKIFMQAAYENKEILRLAQGFNEEETKFCLEFFELFPQINENSRKIFRSFWKIWNFVQDFKEIQNFSQILSEILKTCEKPEFFEILEDLENCGRHFEDLKRFREDLETFEYEKILKIMAVYSWSSFGIIQKELKFDIVLTYESKNTENPSLRLKDLKILKFKAEGFKNLIEQTLESKKTQEEIQKLMKNLKILDRFLVLYEILSKMIDSLNQIIGSPYYFQEDFHQRFDVRKAQIKKISTFIEKCEKLREKWQNELKESRVSNYLLNFFNSERLSVIFKWLSSQNQLNIENPLKTIKLVNQSITTLPLTERFEASLKGLNDLLKAVQPAGSENNQNSIQNQFFCKFSSDPLTFTLQFNRKYFNLLPSLSQVYQCNLKSSEEDISLFILRFFLSPEPLLFSLICPEDLTPGLQTKTKSLIQSFSQYNSRNSSLLVVSKNPEFPFESFLSPFEINSSLKEDLIFENPGIQIPKTESRLKIVRSSCSGQGKTSFILQFAEENNLTVETLHFDRSLKLREFLTDLEKRLAKEKHLFHLNLAQIPEKFYFEQILFSLETFNLHFSHSTQVSIHQTSWLFLEIVNGFEEDLLKKMPFLNALQLVEIDDFSMNRVRVDKQTAFVSRYLQICEDGDLSEKLSFNATNLNFSKEIQETFEFFFLSCCSRRLSFHQLRTFTKVLSCLLENYEKSELNFSSFQSRCPETLTTDILQSIIETTKELLSKPDSSGSNPFNFRFLSSFLTFFNESGDYLLFYKSAASVPRSLYSLLTEKRPLKSWVSQVFSKIHSKFKTNLEEYSKMTCEDLLRKLLNFFIMSLYKKASPVADPRFILESRVEELNVGDFVLTPDGFWKINMIYLKALAEVPIFISGGRGTGKTSLIKFFVNQVLQERLVWLDVNSKTCLNQVEDLINQANSDPNELRTWLVFDQIQSSEYLTDIVCLICDRRFKTLKIDEKVVFVAISRSFHSAGCLFPAKILEYVWDFGDLDSLDVANYAYGMMTKAHMQESKVFTNLITEVHIFFQETIGKSVDLKDVQKFIRTTQILEQFLEHKSKFSPFITTCRYEKLKTRLESWNLKKLIPGIISLFLTYSFKLPAEQFENFFLKLGKVLKSVHRALPDKVFLQIIEFEKLDLVNRFRNLEKFQGFFENSKKKCEIFTLFYSVLAKIPAFIMKNQEIQELLKVFQSNLQAEKSCDDFFKTLPKFNLVWTEVSGFSHFKRKLKEKCESGTLEAFLISESLVQSFLNECCFSEFCEFLEKNEGKEAFVVFYSSDLAELRVGQSLVINKSNFAEYIGSSRL